MIKTISPKNVLFIKLGEHGGYEKECIIESQTLRLGYKEIDHQSCLRKDWPIIYNYYIEVEHRKPFVATNQINQIKQFYEANEETLWVTFYAKKLWWCFSEPIIALLPDKSKTRPVIGSWSDSDINGNSLNINNISGKLSKVQGFRGTICNILESKYAVSKINGEQLAEVKEVETAMYNLKTKLSELIRHLTWQDFEVLIDLIFRQGGWQRLSPIGSTQKTLDLDLLSPVTNERAMVQVKSKSNLTEYKNYKTQFAETNTYEKYFYIVHTN